MATSLKTRMRAGINAVYNSGADLGSDIATQEMHDDIVLANGTAADQANKVFKDQRTLGASATENLDLAGGLTDPFGTTLTFATIKAILIRAVAANTNNVVIGGAATNTFLGIFSDATDKIAVKPGGAFLWCAPGTGAAVTAGTGDILLVANSGAGTGVTYDIVVIGTQ